MKQMTQAEIMEMMVQCTHDLFTSEFVDVVNDAFGTKIKPQEYQAGGGPKGLTLNNGADSALGIACFDLAPELCRELNVPFQGTLGRGFQVRACVDALKAAGYPKQ